MGSKPAPSYANIHMAKKIDPKFWEIATKCTAGGEIPIKLLKHFLDDIFMVYTGSVSNLHIIFEETNKIHPKIKFTMTHTTPKNTHTQKQCSCELTESIPFSTHCAQLKKAR